MIIGATDIQDILSPDKHAHPPRMNVSWQLSTGEVTKVQWPVRVGHTGRYNCPLGTMNSTENGL